MTTTPDPPAPEPGPRQDNGLRASTYVPLTDVEPEVGQLLLTALGRARIAAYLSADGPQAPPEDLRRLFVASEERGDARTIVAAAVRALNADDATRTDATGTAIDETGTDTRAPAGPSSVEPVEPVDPLAGMDTDSVFDALVADWHVDTHAAIRDAERDLNREDSEWRARLSKPAAEDPVWLDDDHYVPPPPPPLPRLSGPTIIAIVILAFSIFLLGFGGQVGLGGEFLFVVGLVGLLAGAGILFSRVGTTGRDDTDDDGAAL